MRHSRAGRSGARCGTISAVWQMRAAAVLLLEREKVMGRQRGTP
jgi:hypothetical protein